jgi:hypothetical protein
LAAGLQGAQAQQNQELVNHCKINFITQGGYLQSDTAINVVKFISK